VPGFGGSPSLCRLQNSSAGQPQERGDHSGQSDPAAGFQLFGHAPHVKIVCNELRAFPGHGSQYAITSFVYERELVDVHLARASLEELACGSPTCLEFVNPGSRQAPLQDQSHFRRVFGNADSQHVSLSRVGMGSSRLLLSELTGPLTFSEDWLSDLLTLCFIAPVEALLCM
jgi:hypothetical protein